MAELCSLGRDRAAAGDGSVHGGCTFMLGRSSARQFGHGRAPEAEEHRSVTRSRWDARRQGLFYPLHREGGAGAESRVGGEELHGYKSVRD